MKHFGLILVSFLMLGVAFSVIIRPELLDVDAFIKQNNIDINKVKELISNSDSMKNLKAWAEGTSTDTKTIDEILKKYNIDPVMAREALKDPQLIAKFKLWAEKNGFPIAQLAQDTDIDDTWATKTFELFKTYFKNNNYVNALEKFVANRDKGVIDQQNLIEQFIKKTNVDPVTVLDIIKRYRLLEILKEWQETSKSGRAQDVQGIAVILKEKNVDPQELKKLVQDPSFPERAKVWIQELKDGKTEPSDPALKAFMLKYKLDVVKMKAMAMKDDILQGILDFVKTLN